jgi:hypothetical protein
MQTSRLAAAAIAALLTVPARPDAAHAQYISLKTVPLAAGDQFLVYPSATLGMGGVSIALDDPLLDPFVNPAKGARLAESIAFTSPTFYSISNNAGNAKTLPAGILFTDGAVFGGGLVALQELENGEQFFGGWPVAELRSFVPPNALTARSATNKYAFLLLGGRLPGDLAIGASAFLADLNAVDGVEHLYALSSGIDQWGSTEDFRIGLTKGFGRGRRLEVVALHNRFDMTHEVAYVEWVPPVDSLGMWRDTVRIETNLDHTRTWGGHLGYEQPIGVAGWRLGGILTVNRKSHPKIPNYEIMNIPRDPGHSTAFDFGVGISKVSGNTTFAMDVVYEPASSDTWAEADTAVTTSTGTVIPAGGKTVENAFSFSNALVNVGLRHVVGAVDLQLGLGVRAYDYHLDQWDHVAVTTRRADEQWMEWSPSWGLGVKLASVEIRYFGRAITGTGRPGIAWAPSVAPRAFEAGTANDVILAPSGPLTLQESTVVTHQFGVVVPIH